MKDQQLRIRIDPDLHTAFKQACLEIDRPASQVLRELMRSFLENRDQGRQRTLDLEETATRPSSRVTQGKDSP
jgi:hypothetical protein